MELYHVVVHARQYYSFLAVYAYEAIQPRCTPGHEAILPLCTPGHARTPFDAYLHFWHAPIFVPGACRNAMNLRRRVCSQFGKPIVQS